MKAVAFAVERPVATSMILLMVALLGLLSWLVLPQDLFPKITLPQLTVITSYPHAAPKEVESLITRPLEEALRSSQNLKKLHSISMEGRAVLLLTFNWGTDIQFASLEVRESLDRVKQDLPKEVKSPIVKIMNPFEFPLMILSLSGNKISQKQLIEIARKEIKEKCERVPGIAFVRLNGLQEKEIYVDIDPEELKKRKLDLMQVIQTIKENNVNYPAGTAKKNSFDVIVRSFAEFKKIEEMRSLVLASNVRTTSGSQSSNPFKERVTLKEVGRVGEGFKEGLSLFRFNGQDQLTLLLTPQPQANLVQVSKRVHQTLQRIEDSLPASVSLNVVYDKSKFIKTAIAEVVKAALFGGGLAFFVMVLFLGKGGRAFVVSLALPLSLAFSVTLMYFMGISLNMISMAGLVLSLGMLIDNAIVILENISRHRGLGCNWKEASKRGANEVASPLGASFLTTAVVFLPILFLSGMEAQLFKELGFTVLLSLLASYFISFLLLPRWMASQKESKEELSKGTPSRKNRFQRGLHKRYLSGLQFCWKRPKKVFSTVALLFFLCCLSLFSLPKELLPKIDRGEFWVKVTLPPGSNLSLVESKAKVIEDWLLQQKEAKRVMVSMGEESDENTFDSKKKVQARILVSTDPKIKGGAAQLLDRLKQKSSSFNLNPAEVEFVLENRFFNWDPLGKGGITLLVRGDDLDRMERVVHELKQEIKKMAECDQVFDSIPKPTPELRVTIQKDRGALFGLSAEDISLTAQASLKGVVATKMNLDGDQIPIRVRLDPQLRRELSDLKGIFVHSDLGEEIPLVELAEIQMGMGPSEITRLDGLKFFSLHCQPKKGKKGNFEKRIKQLLTKKVFPEGIEVSLSGEIQERARSFKGLKGAFILSVLLIYMILGAQFESFLEPFLILLSIPFSLIGVAVGLVLTQTPISIMVFLGMIFLGGIAVNNGIMLLQTIHQFEKEGKLPKVAIQQACLIRLRPILMNTLTTLFAMIPFVFSRDPTLQVQQPVALTLATGLLASSGITLFLLPLIRYTATKHLRGQVSMSVGSVVP